MSGNVVDFGSVQPRHTLRSESRPPYGSLRFEQDLMLTYDQALKLMQDSADSLHRSGLTESPVVVSQATVLLGSESSLDSMAFVTLISDLEERVSRAVNKELYLVLTDIHEFNHDKGELSAETLARHIVAMANK